MAVLICTKAHQAPLIVMIAVLHCIPTAISLTTGAVSLSNAHFGEGSEYILLDEVSCMGNEVGLINCAARPLGLHDCTHRDDVGVECLLGEI